MGERPFRPKRQNLVRVPTQATTKSGGTREKNMETAFYAAVHCLREQLKTERREKRGLSHLAGRMFPNAMGNC